MPVALASRTRLYYNIHIFKTPHTGIRGAVPVNQPLQRFKAEFFKALAHPMRITILELLRNGELSVGELQERLAVDPSSVSQQLAVLRARNIVEARRTGANV